MLQVGDKFYISTQENIKVYNKRKRNNYNKLVDVSPETMKFKCVSPEDFFLEHIGPEQKLTTIYEYKAEKGEYCSLHYQSVFKTIFPHSFETFAGNLVAVAESGRVYCTYMEESELYIHIFEDTESYLKSVMGPISLTPKEIEEGNRLYAELLEDIKQGDTWGLSPKKDEQ